MQLLQAGEIQMIASKWPAGFYEEGTYNPSDRAKGLFRNHVVARVRSASCLITSSHV